MSAEDFETLRGYLLWAGASPFREEARAALERLEAEAKRGAPFFAAVREVLALHRRHHSEESDLKCIARLLVVDARAEAAEAERDDWKDRALQAGMALSAAEAERDEAQRSLGIAERERETLAVRMVEAEAARDALRAEVERLELALAQQKTAKLEALADLRTAREEARREERERCAAILEADVLEELGVLYGSCDQHAARKVRRLAAAIRALGDE